MGGLFLAESQNYIMAVQDNHSVPHHSCQVTQPSFSSTSAMSKLLVRSRIFFSSFQLTIPRLMVYDSTADSSSPGVVGGCLDGW